MRQIRPSYTHHPKYSDCPIKQKAMEDGVDAMTASIIDLVTTVTHKRLTQFAQLVCEKIEQPNKEG